MADFSDVGALLGLPASNELSYQKGLSLGANTQNAMQQARERVRKNSAMDSLPGLADQLGIPAAMLVAVQAGIDPRQITGASKDIQENDFRTHVVDPTTGANQTQRYLAGLAPGSFAQPIDKVGGGAVSKLNPEAGIIPLPRGAHEQGGGISAQMQLLMGLGLVDDNGQITDPKLAMSNLREMNHFGEAGGVPVVTNTNPYGGSAPTAPPAGLGGELAPPAPVGGAAPTVVPPSTKAAAPLAATQVIPTATVAGNVAAIANAKERGTAAGTKAAGLPSTLNTFTNFGTDVDNLLAQPGFDSIYGHLQGTGVGQNVTQLFSQDAANASAARETLKSDAFTVAIQKMRGLGQLSNMEGQKVETALTRMFNPRISAAEARIAAAELKLRVANLERVARQEAGDAAVDAAMGGGAAPAAVGGAYADPAKEARYQAWKASQGAK